jgi:hypothetical protein
MANYWDKWEQKAIAAGVSTEVAQLGREVMRDHCEHGKGDYLLGEEADGVKILSMCLEDAQAAKRCFQECLYPDDVLDKLFVNQ